MQFWMRLCNKGCTSGLSAGTIKVCPFPVKKRKWLSLVNDTFAKVDSRLRGSRFEQKLKCYALFTENWIITSSREAEIAESEVFLFCSQ